MPAVPRHLWLCAVGTGLFGLGSLVLLACGGSDDPSEGSSGSSGSSGGTSSGSSGETSSGSGGVDDDGVTTLSSEQRSGVATFYDYSGGSEVACSFPVESGALVVAMNPPEYAKAASCGACLDVSGPKGKVVVQIVDLCPGCEKGHIDLSEEAFVKIADRVDGKVPITYQAVSCPAKGNVSYHYKDGSSKYWTAIQVRNHRLPITKVEYKKNGTYTNMPRSTYNYFIDPKGIGDQPAGLSIRVTAASGETIEETITNVVEDTVVAGTKQF